MVQSAELLGATIGVSRSYSVVKRLLIKYCKHNLAHILGFTPRTPHQISSGLRFPWILYIYSNRCLSQLQTPCMLSFCCELLLAELPDPCPLQDRIQIRLVSGPDPRPTKSCNTGISIPAERPSGTPAAIPPAIRST